MFNILVEMVMRETQNGFQGGLQIKGQIVTSLRYADDIILLATSEAELQELVDRLDQVSRKYSLLINVNKIKLMASDGNLSRVQQQYLGSLIAEDNECTTEFCTRLNRSRRSGHHCRKYGKDTAYRF